MITPNATLSPKPLERAAGDPRVVRRVLRISVSKVVLHRSQIGALVGKVVAAVVPKHVGPDSTELGLLASKPDDVVDGLAGQLGLTLGQEQPGQIVLPGG